MKPVALLSLACALALAACSPAGDGAGAERSEAGVVDADTDGVAAAPPAPPAPPSPPQPPQPPAAAPGVPVYDETLVNFGGYRTAIFNSDAGTLRAAYGQPLEARPAPETPEACHYLVPPAEAGRSYGNAFMFEGGKFVRVDFDRDDVVAPGGLTVGMTADDVLAAFPDAEQQPHKYVDGGRYLVVKPADGGEARLVFEVDASGTITEWRMGLEPQVHYVEGCS